MTGLTADLRSALRYFSRNRGLSLVALSSLAVGIGASTAITTIANSVFIRPLPYDRPEELVMIWRAPEGRPSVLAGFRDDRENLRQLLTPGMILRWREQQLPFTDLAVVESWQTGLSPRVDLIDAAGVERLRGTLATPSLFTALGVRAALGRTFQGEEHSGVVVISHHLWRRRFGADPAVRGRTITLATGRTRERGSFEIIGVLPERFRFTYPEETEIWLPLSWSAMARETQAALMYRAVARLRPGVTVQAAQAAMQAFLDPLDRNPRRPMRLWLEPVHDYAVGQSRPALLLVAALTFIVLASGAVNAATVFAASTVSRLRDLRIRVALGASHARIVAQILTETTVMAVFAGWSPL